MNHMIYLKLKQEKLSLKADQIYKMTTILTQNDKYNLAYEIWIGNEDVTLQRIQPQSVPA